MTVEHFPGRLRPPRRRRRPPLSPPPSRQPTMTTSPCQLSSDGSRKVTSRFFTMHSSRFFTLYHSTIPSFPAAVFPSLFAFPFLFLLPVRCFASFLLAAGFATYRHTLYLNIKSNSRDLKNVRFYRLFITKSKKLGASAKQFFLPVPIPALRLAVAPVT